MPSHIFSGLPNGRRRRQACPDPPSFDLGQGFTTDADARAWMSSTDTGDIWSCAVSGTQLCNCKSEVSNASPSVQALAVDEARVYWTDTNGVFYVELSNRTVFITLSTMATTQLLATSPGLQQLPGASVLAGVPSTYVRTYGHAYEHCQSCACSWERVIAQLLFFHGTPEILETVVTVTDHTVVLC